MNQHLEKAATEQLKRAQNLFLRLRTVGERWEFWIDKINAGMIHSF